VSAVWDLGFAALHNGSVTYAELSRMGYKWARTCVHLAGKCEPWLKPILLRRAIEHREFARGMRCQALRVESGR
jgi:hypothetical protein